MEPTKGMEYLEIHWSAAMKKTEISGQTQFLGKIGLFCRSLVPLHDKRDIFPPKSQVQSKFLMRQV